MSSGLELLKQALENRKASGTNDAAKKMPHSKATPAVRPLEKAGENDKGSRAYIIENKPKHKVVKEYFQTIVERVVDYVDNEED